MTKSNVAVIGGTGFIGSRLVEVLGADALSRNTDPGVDVLDPSTLGILGSYDVVVYCVGLSPLRTPRVPYSSLHVRGVRNVVNVLREDQFFVLFSAVGADPDSSSRYLSTKGLGEIEANRHGGTAVIRPTHVLGEGSELRNVLGGAWYVPFVPSIEVETNPVCLEDVCEGASLVVEEQKSGLHLFGGERRVAFTDLLCGVKPGPCIRVPRLLWRPVFWLLCRAGLSGLSVEQEAFLGEDFYQEPSPWFSHRVLERS